MLENELRTHEKQINKVEFTFICLNKEKDMRDGEKPKLLITLT